MLQKNLLLAALALAVLLAFFLYRRHSQGENRRPGKRSSFQPLLKNAGEEYSEPETRFVETTQRKPYQLLNTAEQALYHRLVEAMPNLSVFCQIGIAQLAQLRGRQAVEDIRELIGRSVDFLVCMPDFSIIAAIELSWPTDTDPALKMSEDRKRQALEGLGIPLIVFRPHQLPDAEQIADEIARAIVQRRLLEAKRLQREAG